MAAVDGVLPFNSTDESPDFDGADYQPAKDHARLAGQIMRVARVFARGQWLTLREAEDETGDPQASISAQLRHLRKKRFGGHTVERRRRTENGGTYEYRLIVNPQRPIDFSEGGE